MTGELVDATDRELVRLLQADARATFSELASVVGISVATVKRRVDRLRELGVITGFTVQIDHTKLGLDVGAFTEIRYVGSMPPDDMIASIQAIPEVQAAFTLAGDPDVLVELHARDHAHLQEIIKRLRRSGGAVGTKTHIILGGWRRG